MTAKTTTTDPARFAQFADLGNREDFVIPESTDDLTDAELATLLSGAREAFDALYGDGQDLTESDLDALGELTRGIESLDADLAERQQAADERKARADELAAKVRPADAEEDESEADEDDADDDDENADEGDDAQDADEADTGGESADEAPEAADGEQEALVASSARRGVCVNMSRARAKHLRRPEGSGKAQVADLLTSASDSLGFAQGQGVSWDGATSMLERRMQGFSQSAYANAASRGKHLRSQAGLLSVRKPLADGQLIRTGDATEVSEVLNRVADERALSGGSLVAAGGWGAPSTVMYDVLELETREGIFTLPEVGVVRGGFHFTKGPNFADLFEQFTGFAYTEEQDIAGDYDGEGGAKPCHRIEDPDFEEVRLGVEGLCITSGLLQRRGYPELVQRVLRGALVAHDHRVSSRVLSEVADGSTDVTFEDASGTLAPILTAIEVQAESIRQRQRMARNATIEGIFPMWTRGAVRTDLSHRLGVDLLDVTDQRIDAWFRSRGISPQFVYNWQDLSTDETINAWPTEVRFLMYPAGTWVRGTSEIITVDTLFDSTQLGTNDYTALFTEEGVATIKRGWESREVTVPITEPGTVEAIVNSAGGSESDPAA